MTKSAANEAARYEKLSLRLTQVYLAASHAIELVGTFRPEEYEMVIEKLDIHPTTKNMIAAVARFARDLNSQDGPTPPEVLRADREARQAEENPQ
jgi:hypothetical protein